MKGIRVETNKAPVIETQYYTFPLISGPGLNYNYQILTSSTKYNVNIVHKFTKDYKINNKSYLKYRLIFNLQHSATIIIHDSRVLFSFELAV